MSNPKADAIAEMVDEYNEWAEEHGREFIWLEFLDEDSFHKRMADTVEDISDPTEDAETSQGCDFDEEA